MIINQTHDTYLYLKLQSDIFSKSDLGIPDKNPIDIVLELDQLKEVSNLLLGILLDLNKDQNEQIVEVLTALEELDDVQNIFTNANLKNLQL